MISPIAPMSTADAPPAARRKLAKAPVDPMRVLVSECWGITLNVKSQTIGGHTIVASVRASDWGLRGLQKKLYHVRCAIRALKDARDYDALVLCTVGLEAFIVGKLRRWYCPKTAIVCADLLMPREGKLASIVGKWLRKVDGIICIRRGDIQTLKRRFGIPEEKCLFAYFPANAHAAEHAEDSNHKGDANPETSNPPVEVGDYIYSAGSAHRDWPTLIRALARLPYKAIISTGAALEIPPEAKDRIQLLPMQSPEDGRRLMSGARLVVISMAETELPAGPLVLLDAMAMGKPVVATRVNGTRDYVDHGKTGLLIDNGNADQMESAIRRMMENPEDRAAMAAAGRHDALHRFTLDKFMNEVIGVCARVTGRSFFAGDSAVDAQQEIRNR